MKFYRRLMRFIGTTCENERQLYRREIAHLNATGEDMQRTVTTNAQAIRAAVAALASKPPTNILP